MKQTDTLIELIEHKGLLINSSYLGTLERAGLDSFDALMRFSGGSVEVEREERSVVRLAIACEDGTEKAFYLKRHSGQGGRGRLGSLISGAATEDGRNEWEKILELRSAGFDTMTPVAFGERSHDGLVRSLTLTEEIYDAMRVEDYIPTLDYETKGIEGVHAKRRLIHDIACLARRFHERGFNHQDFYLGHIFVRPGTGELFLLDLQRVQRRGKPVKRWVEKDLGQLLYTAAITENFTRTDMVRFAHAYLGKDKFDKKDKKMVRSILARVRRIARHTEKLLEKKGKKAPKLV